jgi:hypothetical protein
MCVFLHSHLDGMEATLTAALDRYKKMVYDFLANWCGRQFVEQLPEASYHKARFSSPAETFDAMSDMSHIYSPGTYTTTTISIQQPHISDASCMLP